MSAKLSVIFYIILCLEIGIVLTLLPWITYGTLGLSDWGQNYFLLYATRKTGVHALQNYFHFDYDGVVNPHFVYKMNAILPGDIVVKKLEAVGATAHCRFDAVGREYNLKLLFAAR